MDGNKRYCDGSFKYIGSKCSAVGNLLIVYGTHLPKDWDALTFAVITDNTMHLFHNFILHSHTTNTYHKYT